MATFATGGFHGTRYCKEDEFAVTPTDPIMKGLRHTSNSLILSKESFQSNELRSDAQISDFRHGNRQASGDIGIELSFAEYDDFLAAAVRSEWKDDPDAPGQKYLVAGTDMSSFTIERVFNDIQQYQTFTGCEVGTFTFTVAPNAMVTGTISLVGSKIDFSGEPLDPDPLPSETFSPFDGFRGKLVEGGSEIAVVTSMELTIENNIEAAFVIGSDVAEALIAGRINVSGTISAYFQNMDLLKKFTDEIETSLQFTLGDGISESYIFTLPRVKYSGGDNPVDGEGAITLSMPFQALYDDCSFTNIRIDRIPAAAIPACVVEYSDTNFQQAVGSPGTFETGITAILSGGNGRKTFNGTIGQAIPGVEFTGVPAGLMAQATKVNSSTAAISLLGVADSPISSGTTFTVEFTPRSVMFGYCHCPNDEFVDGQMTLTIS